MSEFNQCLVEVVVGSNKGGYPCARPLPCPIHNSPSVAGGTTTQQPALAKVIADAMGERRPQGFSASFLALRVLEAGYHLDDEPPVAPSGGDEIAGQPTNEILSGAELVVGGDEREALALTKVIHAADEEWSHSDRPVSLYRALANAVLAAGFRRSSGLQPQPSEPTMAEVLEALASIGIHPPEGDGEPWIVTTDDPRGCERGDTLRDALWETIELREQWVASRLPLEPAPPNYVLALRNVMVLALRMTRYEKKGRTVEGAADHLLRFCASVGVVPSPLRDTESVEPAPQQQPAPEGPWQCDHCGKWNDVWSMCWNCHHVQGASLRAHPQQEKQPTEEER